MVISRRALLTLAVAGGLMSALPVGITRSVAAEDAPAAVTARYPELPEAITSFGAAVTDGYVYIYGGNTGTTHQYSVDLQSDRFRRMKLDGPAQWENLPGESRLQGLAMVAHGGKLYRIGGFSARNKTGEAKDLWSVADVARFDPTANTWEKLPSLPMPRSSHDAVVLGDQIYVAGGWAMHGKEGKSEWHSKALVMDLSQPELSWQELPEAPFRRRALSLATHAGKIYMIGGILEEGSTTTEVDVYDPVTKEWDTAPDLPGESMEGFGNSSFEVGGRLLVSTVGGNLLQLDGDHWNVVTKLQNPRFFHRMLPLSQDEVVILGGSSRAGKRSTVVETVKVVSR